MKFNHIGFPNQLEDKGTQRHAKLQTQIFSGLRTAGVGTFMRDPPLGRVTILVPLLLDVDQSTLPLAKQQVLEGGEGQKVVFSDHNKP